MERRFQHDFASVRIHTDSAAAASTESIGALGYTLGEHLAFARGEYQPRTARGQRLLAHELTHVVQQRGTPDGMASTVFPQFSDEQCEATACTRGQCDTLHADLERALDYVGDAVSALERTPPDGTTSRLLQWYFHSGSDTADAQILGTLQAISTRLTAVRDAAEVICVDRSSPDAGPCRRGSTYAYVWTVTGGTPGAVHVCRPSYFRRGERQRAEAMIHECGHQVGLSIGAHPDVYYHSHNFLYLSAPSARMNSDSYALFASSISQGMGPTFVFRFGGGLGAAFTGGDPRLYSRPIGMSLALEHPDLLTFSPYLGVDLMTIQVPGLGRDVPLLAPQAGVSFDVARDELTARLGLQGGPTVSFPAGQPVSVGAQATVEGGLRWRFVEIAAEVGYLYNPAAPEEARHVLLVGGNARIDFGELVTTLVAVVRGSE
jgi:uncharacterized protein DUF4157/lysine-specific metallo-endopeptidase family protein